MDCLLSSSIVGLMATSSKWAYATHSMTQVCCSQSSCPQGRPLLTHASTGDTQRQVWLSLCILWILVYTSLCLSPPSISGGYGAWFSTWFCHCYHSVGISLLPLHMGYLFWWDPTFSCLRATGGCSAVSWNFGILSGEDELMSFYSTIFSSVTENGDCNHEIKRLFLLERKDMTNLDSIIKSRDTTLLTKICLVSAMVFPVVMYGCES